MLDTSNKVKGARSGESLSWVCYRPRSSVRVLPPLAGALLYINQTRNAVLGGSALFALALAWECRC
jgi:hypothetical protein